MRLQKRALLSWSVEARRLAIKAANKAAADEHARLGRLRRALDTWREHVDHCAAQRLAADFHRRTTLRAVVVLWLQHAQHESEQQAKWFRAVRHRYFVLVAAGLRGLQEAVDRRSAKLQLYGRMAAHYHCHLLRTAMTAWSRDFCPAMAARRLAMARAALKWRTSLLRKAIRVRDMCHGRLHDGQHGMSSFFSSAVQSILCGSMSRALLPC